MPTEGNPIVLYSGGIPISPADLDFGNAGTQAQINALSRFSQMVNAVPGPGNVWVSTGAYTWGIYDLVLSMAEFAQSAQAAMPAPHPANQSNAASLLATLDARIFPLLSEAGFQFGKTDSLPLVSSEDKDETSLGASSESLASLFLQLKAQFTIDAMTDTLGNQFYPTYLFPADFYDSQYDASWKPFQLTPGQNDPWIPVGQGSTVSGEMITLPLQRAWWSTWVFENRGWQFDPSSGFGKLSDGGSPPQGMMPMYASALIIARDIKIVPPPPGTSSSPPVQTNPFILKGQKTPAPLSVSDSTAMMIIGFVCTPLPACPNPDPSLNW